MKNIFKDKKKKIFLQVVMCIIIFVLFFLFLDLLLKSFFFKNNDPIMEKKYYFIGTRSHRNYSTTFFNFLDWDIPIFVIHFITFIPIPFFLCLIFIFKSKNIFFSIIFIISGLLGNGIDRLMYGFVRDILFIPWFDGGTFNLADVFIVFGILYFAFAFLIQTAYEQKEKIKYKNNKKIINKIIDIKNDKKIINKIIDIKNDKKVINKKIGEKWK